MGSKVTRDYYRNTMPKVKRKKKVSNERSSSTAEAASKKVPKRTKLDTSPEAAATPTPRSDKVAGMIYNFRLMLTSHVASHPECNKYAPAMSKYMRNQFAFMGLKAPTRRALQKTFLEENGDKLKECQTLIKFVHCLWEEEEREFQGFGVDLMIQYKDVLLGETQEEFHEAVGLAEHCVITKSWWDTVDAIAYPVVGYFVKQRPLLGVPLMQQWIEHDYMWLRRVAILHQNCHKKSTDADLLFSLCLKSAHETEFFIRKAIGWALRDYAKTNKKAVKDFVEKNRTLLSALSIREALKHC